MDRAVMVEVTTETELRSLVGSPIARVANKSKSALVAVHREWLASSPFCLMASAAADGTCDVSPKGDPPGFTKVLDDTTIAIPDRPGNRRADGFSNILSNPHVGLVFFIPGRGDTLRINGRARIVRDAPFFDEMVVAEHRPTLAVVVEIEQVFFHCAKAFLRSKLWEPDSWDPGVVASRAAIAKAIERPEESIEALEAYYGPAYDAHLYG